jgi:protein TonB
LRDKAKSALEFYFSPMADTHILPPESNDRPSINLTPAVEAPHLGTELKEEGVFASLFSSIRDVFFPAKLPPLVLESKPIAVIDPMKTKMSRTSIAGSIAIYALIILLVAFLIRKHIPLLAKPDLKLTQLELTSTPPVAPKVQKIGGGGGQHDLAPVSAGHLPKFADQQIVPPKAPPTIPPKLAVEPTVVMQPDLKMANNTMPNIGAPTSSLTGNSLGNGTGTGIGSGNGAGIGPGSGYNTGGGPVHIGGGVKAPILTFAPEPEFSEEARKAKFSGDVQVYLWVDEQGLPSHVRIIRGVGMGLDEKALEAVRQYKFKPALKDGKPVKVDLYINVNFQIF